MTDATGTIRVANYNQWLAAGRPRRERIPLSCLFEITPTCNLRCRFCYVALDPYRGPYLSTEQIRQILDKLEQAGVLYLTLTGGEIFSRRDFDQIYRYAKEKGFLVILYSNATLVNERVAALLRELPPFLMEVSIYGADAEHYERVTQIPGSFARFVRGIDLLREAGVKLVLKAPISNLSEDHLEAMVGFCQDRNLPFKADLSIDPTHDGNQRPIMYRIEARKIGAMRERVWEVNKKYAADDMDVPRPRSGLPLAECADVSAERSKELYQCGAGRTGFFIDGLGNASHCVIDRDPSFPILDLSFEEVWRKMGEWVTQPLPESAPCHGCSMRGECSNCPARSRLATGSPYLKDTYACDITHLDHGLEPAQHPDYRSLARRQLGVCVA